MSLRAYQEEMKRQVFPGPGQGKPSRLWPKPPARLEVYRRNARLNWQDTLDADFPLTRGQWEAEAWRALTDRFFAAHPPAHWELNASMTPFLNFLGGEKVPAHVKELADYEWQDLRIFIDRSTVAAGAGVTNPTAQARVYQHQIFYWVDAGAPKEKPPRQKPEVLVFYRDARNTCHVAEGDPLMLLMMEHFRRPGARLEDLEPARRKLLPQNRAPLETVYENLKTRGLFL